MIKVRQISHATFETPDLEAQIEHYSKVTGLVVAAREKDRVLLTSKVGQLVLQLKRGERPNRRTAEEGDELAPVHRGISCRQARVFVEQRSTPRARC